LWFVFCRTLLASLLVASFFVQTASAKAHNENTSGPSEKNYKLGLKAFQRGEFDAAVDAELQAIYYARNGYQPDAYFVLGEAYESKKDYPKAYEALTKCIGQAMNGANEAHLALSRVCTAMKKYQESTGETTKALQGVNFATMFWGRCKFQQGYNLEEWGNPDAASACYVECLGKWPWKYWHPWIHYCECLMKLKKWVEAYTSLESMMTTDQTIKGLDFERVYLDMGICALAKGNHQGALDNWHKVLQYNPDNVEAHLQLGLMLDSEQHMASAITEYKAFIRGAGSEDIRIKQVETRISLLEQMQGKQDPAPPPPVAPSLYMRNQQEKQKQQQAQPTGDPGF